MVDAGATASVAGVFVDAVLAASFVAAVSAAAEAVAA